mgnify:CR=1 FL=1
MISAPGKMRREHDAADGGQNKADAKRKPEGQRLTERDCAHDHGSERLHRSDDGRHGRPDGLDGVVERPDGERGREQRQGEHEERRLGVGEKREPPHRD